MTRWAAGVSLGSLIVTACANVQPQPYRVDGATKAVTSADIRSIVVMAQKILYGYAPVIPPRWPIYRVHFRNAGSAEIWYGDPNADRGIT